MGSTSLVHATTPTAFGNRLGLFVGDSSDGTSVRGNSFYGNLTGVFLFDVILRGSLELVDNEATMNHREGFRLLDVNAGSVLLSGNRASFNAGDGFAIETGNASFDLRFNSAESNGRDGFSADEGGVRRFRGNRALANQRAGIFARGAIVDEGSNVAEGNGGSLQCIGVVCG